MDSNYDVEEGHTHLPVDFTLTSKNLENTNVKEENSLNKMMTVEEYNELLDWMYSNEDSENQLKKNDGGIIQKIYETVYGWFIGK